MEPILKGILAGLAYGLLLGPMFFVSLRVTLSQGWRNGVALVGGAFASDMLLVTGGWWSAAKLAEFARQSTFQSGFGLLSGLILLGFGISAVWPKKQPPVQNTLDEEPVRRRYSILQGFLINMTNPSNWLFWISLATLVRAESIPENNRYAETFLITTLIVVLATDLSKVLLAHQIGKRLKPGHTQKVVQIAGIMLIIVSSWILFKVIKNAF
ncbi:MAG: LysE family transporter [Lewinellaceae bacterium]|nr:LysE family transporter [Lewinellaceae bacterium]